MAHSEGENDMTLAASPPRAIKVWCMFIADTFNYYMRLILHVTAFDDRGEKGENNVFCSQSILW